MSTWRSPAYWCKSSEKLPAHHVLIGNHCRLRQSLAHAKTFVVAKEKCLVLLNGSAKCGAKLVLLVAGF